MKIVEERERLEILSGSVRPGKVSEWIGKRVETDPSGLTPISEKFPPGTRCHLIEINSEGTLGIITYVPPTEE
ncbi:hypothetical protein COS55_00105 [Candidatus Shapirobacteria bacterium CG03_land_8_20_14_0_80_40_19]|uniref:Uncharacterized protein n=2 Tax=Candidatus Shapironibacteriota TaxID=1752721 RepID=A0A2M7BGI6_9BACT|nr:MAG: hypothetical protein COV89_00515 [Candidatus Shapirobacteria bacterium CG11_big_fil_rev_8_21_14_0_20_40_12]PIV02199.1 MAG: hypothetical protein COS55_00105 [Candidatus Shapirobacteria bacterium CG03_land_8_20_14_0_80_40_19]